jgi:molybdopterin-guanine dinucleotide biosynthesis protein A
VVDLYPGCGPAGAIVTALTALKHQSVFVVACDMPVIEPSALKLLEAQIRNRRTQAALALVNDRLEPLYGFYDQSAKSALIEEATSGKGKVKNALSKLSIQTVDISACLKSAGYMSGLPNLNTPTDLLKFKHQL